MLGPMALNSFSPLHTLLSFHITTILEFLNTNTEDRRTSYYVLELDAVQKLLWWNINNLGRR